jgi:uncharacterized protein (DUF2236 family)
MVPGWLRSCIEIEARKFLLAGEGGAFDFRRPEGEPALIDPHSVSWRVFKNPVTLLVGGITAVLLELAEPRIRSGVWEHTNFRRAPVDRLRRTGLAAMMTVYGPKSRAETMIARIGRMHRRVSGVTAAGEPYSASDPELLDWVHATAAFGFLEAYRAYAHPLSAGQASQFYAEGRAAAELYGALNAPDSDASMAARLAQMMPKFEPSPIIFEFLTIMAEAPLPPRGARLAQAMLIRAGVEILPLQLRERLGLGPQLRLRAWEKPLVKAMARLAERTPLAGTPPVEASLRLGLPADFLYGGARIDAPAAWPPEPQAS